MPIIILIHNCKATKKEKKRDQSATLQLLSEGYSIHDFAEIAIQRKVESTGADAMIITKLEELIINEIFSYIEF